MRKNLELTVAALALTATLGLAGCSTSTGEAAPPATATATASASSSPSTTLHNGADVMFAQMMMPHHSQAVEMSEMLLAKPGISEEVRQLASDISAAQQPEIEELSAMLDKWGDPQEAHMGHSMDGMMSDGDMTALEAATGPEAERLFLEQMIRHHTGAIEMARTEVEDGKSPAAVAMAKDIVSAQQVEIDQMEGMLAAR